MPLKKDISNNVFFTFNDDDTLGRVGSHVVGGHAAILSGVPGLGVDDLDRDHAVRVGDRVLGRIQLLSALQPFDLKYLKKKTYSISLLEPSFRELQSCHLR